MKPKMPIHVDQLKPEARALVSKMQFSKMEFDKKVPVQPLEHADCSSWGFAYLTSDRKRILPIAGREQEYAEHFDEMRAAAEQEGILIKPPQSGGHRGK
jgi:hypothetical protein